MSLRELDRLGTGKGGFGTWLPGATPSKLGLLERACTAVPFCIITDLRILGWRVMVVRVALPTLTGLSKELRLDAKESSGGRA